MSEFMCLVADGPLGGLNEIPSGEHYAERQERLRAQIVEAWRTLVSDLYAELDWSEDAVEGQP